MRKNDKETVATIKHNKPDLPVFDHSITDVDGSDLKKAGKFGRSTVPLVALGPLYQALNVFRNRLGIEDVQGQLAFEFIRIIEETKPATFLMENVRGLLSISIAPKKKELLEDSSIPKEYFEKGSLLNKIFEDFNKLRYHADCFVVNSVNYGEPQIRKRILLTGNRYGHSVDFPAQCIPADLKTTFRNLKLLVKRFHKITTQEK